METMYENESASNLRGAPKWIVLARVPAASNILGHSNGAVLDTITSSSRTELGTFLRVQVVIRRPILEFGGKLRLIQMAARSTGNSRRFLDLSSHLIRTIWRPCPTALAKASSC